MPLNAQVAAQGEVPVGMRAPKSAVAGPAVTGEFNQAQIVAARLRKIWPGGDVGVLSSDEVSDGSEDANEVLSRLNNKYGVYDRYNMAVHTKNRRDLPPVDDTVTESGLPPEAEDYMGVYKAANKLKFDARVDNPEALESMLGSLWGKRYHYLDKEQREDSARNDNTIVMRATPASNERLSQGISTDGSVDKFVAMADDKADIEAAVAEAQLHDLPSNAPPAPFKPSTVWYGPRVAGSALDVTSAKLPANVGERVPNDPPKPPVPSFVIPDFHNSSALPDNEAPVTIIQTIRVTPESKGNGIKKSEKVFTPIMAQPVINPKPAYVVGN